MTKNISNKNKTKAEIVVNTVSVSAIYKTSISCLNFPWICLIEKPPGYNLEEALALNNYVKKKKSIVYVALNRRHYSSTNKALNELQLDKSSRIVKVCDQEDLGDPLRIGHPKEVIDNWMYANSIHMIDYFSMFCRGKLTKVTPIVLWNKNNPKYVASKLQFDSGDIGLYECFWNSPAPWSVSINTENIRLDMTPLESLTKQVYESRKKNNIELDKVDYDFKPGIRLQAELLIKTIKNNKAYLPTLDQAIDTMKIINLIYFKN